MSADATQAPSRPVADGPPKSGPGQIFVEEPIAHGTGYGSVKRSRNIGEHPLTLLSETAKRDQNFIKLRKKAFAREIEAGVFFRELYDKTKRSGVDSTQRQYSERGSSFLPWTATQAKASDQLKEIEKKLGPDNYRILELFCGHGVAMSEAVQRVVGCHPNGVLYRLREALSRLADALRG